MKISKLNEKQQQKQVIYSGNLYGLWKKLTTSEPGCNGVYGNEEDIFWHFLNTKDNFMLEDWAVKMVNGIQRGNVHVPVLYLYLDDVDDKPSADDLKYIDDIMQTLFCGAMQRQYDQTPDFKKETVYFEGTAKEVLTTGDDTTIVFYWGEKMCEERNYDTILEIYPYDEDDDLETLRASDLNDIRQNRVIIWSKFDEIACAVNANDYMGKALHRCGMDIKSLQTDKNLK